MWSLDRSHQFGVDAFGEGEDFAPLAVIAPPLRGSSLSKRLAALCGALLGLPLE
jgi:hypothetical protein